MSLNITAISAPYPDYEGYFVKAYEVDTDTPKAIYFDDQKQSGAVRIKVGENGFFKSDGGARVVAHIEGYYNIYFFKTKYDADNNLINSVDTIDMSADSALSAEISGETITKASETEYGTARFNKDSEILTDEVFSDTTLVSEAQITIVGELSAAAKKATQEDLDNLDDTKILSPNDIDILNKAYPITDPARQMALGDVILIDREEGKKRDDVLPSFGQVVTLAETSQEFLDLDGTSQVGSSTIDGLSNQQQSSLILTGGSTYAIKFIEVNPNLFYGIIQETVVDGGLYNFCKSTDGFISDITILPITHSVNPNGAFLANSGDSKLAIMRNDRATYFDFDTETILVNNISVDGNYGGVISFHYDTDKSKFVFLNRTYIGTNFCHATETTDFVTFDKINVLSTPFTSSTAFQMYSTQQGINFYNGLYYIEETTTGSLYTVDSTTWAIAELYNFTPTLTAKTANWTTWCINDQGHIAGIIGYANNQFEIAFATDRLNFTTHVVDTTIFPSMSDACYITPVKNIWRLKEGDGFESVYTEDFSVIMYETSFGINGTSNYMFSYWDDTNNKVYEYTSSKSSSNFDIFLNSLDASLNIVLGESRTQDMSYECIGNMVPHVKVKIN